MEVKSAVGSNTILQKWYSIKTVLTWHDFILFYCHKEFSSSLTGLVIGRYGYIGPLESLHRPRNTELHGQATHGTVWVQCASCCTHWRQQRIPWWDGGTPQNGKALPCWWIVCFPNCLTAVNALMTCTRVSFICSVHVILTIVVWHSWSLYCIRLICFGLVSCMVALHGGTGFVSIWNVHTPSRNSAYFF